MIKLLFILLILFPSISQADITTGLVGYWKMDEANGGNCSSTTIDSSGNNNTGTCVSNPKYVAGKIGLGALNFNETTNYVNIGTPSNLNLTTNFSLCAWVYANDNTGSQQQIISKGYDGINTQWQLAFTSGIMSFNSFSNPTVNGVNAITAMNFNVWQHWCGTYNGTWSIYFNGALNNTSGSAGPTSTVRSVNIGAVDVGTPPSIQIMSGFIDDARIYNRAITASDVLQLYNFEYHTHLIQGVSKITGISSLN